MSAVGTRTVITGGEGDLALAITTQLTEHGYAVEAPGREELDVTDPAAVRAYFSKCEPDLLICNAGITRDQTISRLTEKDWDEVMAVNLRGTLHCCRAAIEAMKRRAGERADGSAGSIVLISSYSALKPPIGQAAYATAKASLLGLVQDMARAHGEDGIRINAILPGFLETKMTHSVREQQKKEVILDHVLKRLNTCPQVASFIRCLHQDLIHTSGQVFQLDSRLAP